jgi:hypothetical protein
VCRRRRRVCTRAAYPYRRVVAICLPLAEPRLPGLPLPAGPCDCLLAPRAHVSSCGLCVRRTTRRPAVQSDCTPAAAQTASLSLPFFYLPHAGCACGRQDGGLVQQDVWEQGDAHSDAGARLGRENQYVPPSVGSPRSQGQRGAVGARVHAWARTSGPGPDTGGGAVCVRSNPVQAQAEPAGDDDPDRWLQRRDGHVQECQV